MRSGFVVSSIGLEQGLQRLRTDWSGRQRAVGIVDIPTCNLEESGLDMIHELEHARNRTWLQKRKAYGPTMYDEGSDTVELSREELAH